MTTAYDVPADALISRLSDYMKSDIRKLYTKGPIGVSHLRKAYGGRKRNGVRPAHFRKAGGNIIRTLLQQMETAGIVQKDGAKGRVVSAKGRSLLDAMSGQIKREMDRDNPDLKKY
jgi:small subunit ribosomal protein S19e